MTHEEMIAVITAYEEGKMIQFKDKSYGEWQDCPEPVWNFSNSYYRVKPKSELRPYTFEELKEAIKEHCEFVIDKENSRLYAIQCVTDEIVYFSCGGRDYEEFLEKYKWLDDNKPCGVIEND